MTPPIKARMRIAVFVLGVIVLATGVVFHMHRSQAVVAPAGEKAGPAHGESGHEEGGVELSDAKIAAAGIELAVATPGVLRASLALNGVLQPNQEAMAQVTPRFAGIVREVYRRVGEQIAKGDLLAKIESNQSLTVYELRAPIAGTVIDRQVSLGEYASEQKPAFVVANLATVWVDLSVYRRDLRRVRVGDAIAIDAEDGGEPIAAKISYLSPVGSSDTQSALARAVVDNADRRLRPGLFVTGRVTLSEKPVGIAVKSNAIQTVENRPVVFVRVGQKFEAREVEVGERDPHHVEIAFGLMEGDVYASKNSFVIKAELAKGEAHHEH